jgi:hypothetical protein
VVSQAAALVYMPIARKASLQRFLSKRKEIFHNLILVMYNFLIL